MSCFQVIYPSYGPAHGYLPYYRHQYYYGAPFASEQGHNWSPKREIETTVPSASESPDMCRMTSLYDATKHVKVRESQSHDVTELQVTSTRKCSDDDIERPSVGIDHGRHPGLRHQHQDQQQQPTSTQYISDTCVLFTYFTGDIESNVDEHFARALSQPSSFGPNCHGTTPPSVHSTASALANAQRAEKRLRDDIFTAMKTERPPVGSDNDCIVQAPAAATASAESTDVMPTPWSASFGRQPAPLPRTATSVQPDDYRARFSSLHQRDDQNPHQQQEDQRQKRDKLNLAASFAAAAAVMSPAQLPYNSLLQLQCHHQQQYQQQLMMTSAMQQSTAHQQLASMDARVAMHWSRSDPASASCFPVYRNSSHFIA